MRPFGLAAVLRNITFTEVIIETLVVHTLFVPTQLSSIVIVIYNAYIIRNQASYNSFIDLQEKLHQTIGR